jgi:thiol-disulfide isomerase/thioredoxin
MQTFKKIIISFCCLTALSFTIWQPNFEKATQIAKEKNQLILLNFSGSDWCGPCIRMRSELLESAVFSAMADTSLVLVNADFPRNKKNQLSKEVQKHNEALADKYNPDGKFPYTLLLDTNGRVIQIWDGLPDVNAAAFAQQIKNSCNAYSKH